MPTLRLPPDRVRPTRISPLFLAPALLLPAASARAHGLAEWPATAQIAAIVLGLCILLMLGMVARVLVQRRRIGDLNARNARLSSANVQARQVAQRAEAKARMLDGVLAAMADGVLVVDADFRLAGWNPRFPDYAGVPRRALRIGMPLAEVLRLQAEGGEFGMVDPEKEADRRMRLLQGGGMLERWQRERPDGSRLELRRAPLPGGGFVTLYTPVLEQPSRGASASILDSFAEEWRSRFPRLTAAAADGDTGLAREAAHALRGIALNAGWSAAAMTLQAIETAAEGANLTELRLLTASLPSDPPSWA